MAQLKVFNPKTVLASLLEDEKNNRNTTFLIDVKEPPAGKEYQCTFLKQQFKTPSDEKPAPAILRTGDIAVYIKDPANAPRSSYIEITKGPADPSVKKSEDDEDDEDDAPKKKSTKGGKAVVKDDKPRKPRLATTISKSGDFGQVIDRCDKIWVERIAELRKGDDPKITEAKTNPIVQRRISPKNKGVDKDGKPLKNRPIDDPIIRMTLDFDKYPADYFLKFLAGRPKTEIYDFTTMYADAQGRPAFRLAVVKEKVEENGKIVEKTSPITAENVHKFLRRGCRIVDGRFHMDYGTESGFGVSSCKLAGKLVIDPTYAVDDIGGETAPEYDDESLQAFTAHLNKMNNTITPHVGTIVSGSANLPASRTLPEGSDSSCLATSSQPTTSQATTSPPTTSQATSSQQVDLSKAAVDALIANVLGN
jgi:hypothetical protein